MQVQHKINYYFIVIICFLSLIFTASCTNEMDDNSEEIIFPESLVIEKILGISWKVDKTSMKIINPTGIKNSEDLPRELQQLCVVTEKFLNTILLKKTGDVKASYVILPADRDSEFRKTAAISNSVFYYDGKWTLNKENKEEIFVKVNSPMGILEFRIKIKELSLLNKTLIMEAYFLNPSYSFSCLFAGNGPQEEYWNKETDVADPSWTERNQISEEPLDYSDITGSYSVSSDDWKRVVYIDNVMDNVYPLLSGYTIVFESNGNVRLQGLPYVFFGANAYNGIWSIDKNKVFIDFPLFPFLGDISKYGGIFEIDYHTFLGSRYARHNAGISMEIVRLEKERILVKFTELGSCSAYVYLNRLN